MTAGALLDKSTLCDPGTTSQSGHKTDGKPCEVCPADTYSNGARTICFNCPRGTISQSKSSTVKQCRPPVTDGDAASGAFRYGSEWVGSYTTKLKDMQGNDLNRQGAGAVKLQVVDVQGAKVTFLGTFEHGEFCDTQSVWHCRTAGISEFYLTGNVIDGVKLDAPFVRGSGGWIGITGERAAILSDCTCLSLALRCSTSSLLSREMSQTAPFGGRTFQAV